MSDRDELLRRIEGALLDLPNPPVTWPATPEDEKKSFEGLHHKKSGAVTTMYWVDSDDWELLGDQIVAASALKELADQCGCQMVFSKPDNAFVFRRAN